MKKIVCPGKITALSVSPDGNYCLVALVEKVYVWQVSSTTLIFHHPPNFSDIAICHLCLV